MGCVHEVTSNRATIDFPSHRIKSVSHGLGAGLIYSHAETINDIIKTTYMPTMQEVELEGIRVDPPKQLGW